VKEEITERKVAPASWDVVTGQDALYSSCGQKLGKEGSLGFLERLL
jgi:hypothetical protein